LPINVLLMARFWRRRRWLVLGGLAAIAINAIGMLLVVPPEDIDAVTPLFEILAMVPFYFRGLAL
jgi:hypothetical protein